MSPDTCSIYNQEMAIHTQTVLLSCLISTGTKYRTKSNLMTQRTEHKNKYNNGNNHNYKISQSKGELHIYMGVAGLYITVCVKQDQCINLEKLLLRVIYIVQGRTIKCHEPFLANNYTYCCHCTLNSL